MAPGIHLITWGFAGCWASRSFFGLCSERPAGWPRGRGVLGSFWRSPKRANWETPKKGQGGIPTFSQVKPPGESSFCLRCLFGCFLLVPLEERELFCMKTTSLWSCWLPFVLRCNTASQVVLAAMRQDRSALLYASQELRRDKVGRSWWSRSSQKYWLVGAAWGGVLQFLS